MDIILKDIYKYYHPSKSVLRNVNVEIPSGQLTTILGPSGCGKSTLMLLIAGLEKVSNGDIYFDNQCVTKVPPKNRNIGMVFQNSALYPNMTVEENILFPLKNQKVPKSESKNRVKKVLEMVNMEGYENRKPHQLSGGQRQRIAIARAIAKKPNLLILDEPLSALDATLRLNLREEIRQLQQKLEITTILVTHDQDEAMAMSDNIAVVKDGEIQQFGNPLDIVHSPVNWFVAQFLGMPVMNQLECTYNKSKNSLIINGMDTVINLVDYRVNDLAVYENKELILGFRLHDVDIITDDQGQKGYLRGTVKHIEHTGREYKLTLVMGKNDLEIKVLCPTTLKIKNQMNVWFKIRTIQYLFEKDGKQTNIHQTYKGNDIICGA